jgi:hypothetical protein
MKCSFLNSSRKKEKGQLNKDNTNIPWGSDSQPGVRELLVGVTRNVKNISMILF